jgi:hypothetical protein
MGEWKLKKAEYKIWKRELIKPALFILTVKQKANNFPSSSQFYGFFVWNKVAAMGFGDTEKERERTIRGRKKMYKVLVMYHNIHGTSQSDN